MHYLVKSHDLDVFEFDIERKQAYKDKQLCFEDQFEDIYQVKFVEIFSKSLLPAMLRENLELNDLKSDTLNSEYNLKLLSHWIDSRQICRNRQYAQNIRNLYSYDILKSFDKTYGSSLTDSYWIIDKNQYLSNEKLYCFDFIQKSAYSSSEEIAQIALFGVYDERYSFFDEFAKNFRNSSSSKSRLVYK